MLRIVGVQRSETAIGEILLLQNQGSIRVNLRGHVVLSESVFDGANPSTLFHAFGDDIFVPPGVYVALCTGAGRSRWGKSRDGSTVYYCFMAMEDAIWSTCDSPIHILSTQHTYEERKEALLVQ